MWVWLWLVVDDCVFDVVGDVVWGGGGSGVVFSVVV